jgi:hypothetical protein
MGFTANAVTDSNGYMNSLESIGLTNRHAYSHEDRYGMQKIPAGQLLTVELNSWESVAARALYEYCAKRGVKNGFPIWVFRAGSKKGYYVEINGMRVAFIPRTRDVYQVLKEAIQP